MNFGWTLPALGMQCADILLSFPCLFPPRAGQCISEAFGVDLDKSTDVAAYSAGEGLTLPAIVDKFVAANPVSFPPVSLLLLAATRLSLTSRLLMPYPVPTQPAPSPSTSTSAPSKASAPASAEDKAAAEKFKSKGNQLMAAKDYEGAIKSYGEAIEKDGLNPVYWSNR